MSMVDIPIERLQEKKYNHLIILEEVEPLYYWKGRTFKKRRFLCLCDCGNKKVIDLCSIRKGSTKSCGCLVKKKITTHGMSKVPGFTSWRFMIDRCYDPSNHKYKNYGERGIVICKRWKESVVSFLEDMGERPKGYTIDRIKVNGNYSCGHCVECVENGWDANCRWATNKQQSRNKTTTRYLTYKGETKSMKEWSESTGLHYDCIRFRLDSGWSVERTFETTSVKGNNQFSWG